MKKFLLILTLIGAACGSAQAQKTPKVAIVDMRVVFEKYQESIDGRRILEADAKSANQKLEAQQQALKAKQDEAIRAQEETKNPALTEQGRANAQRIFDAKVAEFQKLANEFENNRRNADGTLRQRAETNAARLVDRVRPVIENISKAKGIDLVLNSNLNTVLFADKSLDITDEVVAKLNADYALTPVASMAAQPAPAPAAAPAAGAPAAAAPAPGLTPLPTVAKPAPAPAPAAPAPATR